MSIKTFVIFKNYFFVWLNFTAESMNCFLFLKNLEKKIFAIRLTKKKTLSNTLKIYRNIYRKNLSAIIYQLSISLPEIEIYRLSVSPRTFLKLSIIVIALVQKGLSCPSLPAADKAQHVIRPMRHISNMESI